jgi:hypothetical protein
MKTKETTETKVTTATAEKVLLGTESKPRSLRPMRSMMAVRSLKPRTVASSFVAKETSEKA